MVYGPHNAGVTKYDGGEAVKEVFATGSHIDGFFGGRLGAAAFAMSVSFL